MEDLIAISGPTYLGIFIVVAIFSLIFAWVWVNIDDTRSYQRPDINKFDYVSIAALRGGINAVIRAVLVDLWNKDLIKINPDTKPPTIQNVHSERQITNPIEKKVYDYAKTARNNKDFFTDNKLIDKLSLKITIIQNELERLKLIETKTAIIRSWQAFIIAGTIIFCTALPKLLLGYMRNRPVGYLIALLIISIIGLLFITKPFKKQRITSLGKDFLKDLKENFSWLKDQSIDKDKFNPALCMAIFGIASLALLPNFTDFFSVFPYRTSFTGDTGGCSYGCGGSDSGGDGGGCGGGGCGGCG